MNPPVFDIDPVAFRADPYPAYQRMRAEAPICHVPQLGAILLTRRNDIYHCEKNIEVFSSRQPGGLMTVLMGENMMRKDGEAHLFERRLAFPALSPRTVSQVWKLQFETHADRILDEISQSVGEVDLVEDYAMRLSGEALKAITGLTQISWQEMDACSQAMIDGISNYAGIAEIEERCNQGTALIDRAIDERLPQIAEHEDASLLSVLFHAGMPDASIRANIKLAISGGQNEPRDAIAGCVWALLTHPAEFERVRAGQAGWMQVFDEYCRWIAPIGMSPRRVAKAYCHAGITFEPEQRAFLMFGSANRDENCFDRPDRFDVMRDTSKSIAFGAGPHFCAGAWASRCLVAEVGLPKLFERFPDIAIADPDDCRFGGWAFRGLARLRVNPGKPAGQA